MAEDVHHYDPKAAGYSTSVAAATRDPQGLESVNVQNNDADPTKETDSSKSTRPSAKEFAYLDIPAIDDFRLRLYFIVNNTIFQTFVIALIIVNSIFMGIGTFEVSENMRDFLEKSDEVFLYLFTAELCLQIMVHLHRMFYDPWLVFDFITVSLSLAFKGFTIVRSFRIFRAFRLFARVPALQKIVRAILSTGPQMSAICLVLFLVFYIFAVMFTTLFGECYEDGCYCEDPPKCSNGLGKDYFGRLDLTFMTLFQLMTMDDWRTVLDLTSSKYSLAWVPILIFIVVSSFVMLNLIIAVLCEALSALEPDSSATETEKNSNSDEDAAAVKEMLAQQRKMENLINSANNLLRRIENLELNEADSTRCLSDIVKETTNLRGAMSSVTNVQNLKRGRIASRNSSSRTSR